MKTYHHGIPERIALHDAMRERKFVVKDVVITKAFDIDLLEGRNRIFHSTINIIVTVSFYHTFVCLLSMKELKSGPLWI